MLLKKRIYQQQIFSTKFKKRKRKRKRKELNTFFCIARKSLISIGLLALSNTGKVLHDSTIASMWRKLFFSINSMSLTSFISVMVSEMKTSIPLDFQFSALLWSRDILCFLMLCFDMLCYIMLWYVILCCGMLCYTILYNIMLCYTI